MKGNKVVGDVRPMWTEHMGLAHVASQVSKREGDFSSTWCILPGSSNKANQ